MFLTRVNQLHVSFSRFVEEYKREESELYGDQKPVIGDMNID